MNRRTFITFVILSTFIMGFSITVVKLGLAYVSPLLLASFRFLFAGIIVAFIVWMIRKNHPKSFQDWLKMIVIGIFQSAGVSVGIFVGLRTATASEISVLTYTSPLFVVLFSTLFLRTRYRGIHWLGVVLGIIGVMITMNVQVNIEIGLVFGLFAAFSWAVATLFVKLWGMHLDTWVLTAYQMLFGGIVLLILSIVLEIPSYIHHPTSVFVVVWLVVMASIIQNLLWFYLLKKDDPAKVTSFIFLAPFFGVCSGWFVLKEDLHFSVLLGGLFIILGIYFVNRPITRDEYHS